LQLVSRKQSLVYDESCVDPLERSLPGCFNFDSMGKSVLRPALALLLQAISLCNKSSFDRAPRRRARAAGVD